MEQIFQKYCTVIVNAFTGYWNYLVSEILFSYDYKPWYENYFYALILVSLIAWLLELAFPWRRQQSAFRKDFWIDLFYMFFNYFLFSLILYNALSNVAVTALNDFLGLFGITNIVAIEIGTLPAALQLFIAFVVADFIQWNIHRMLHRFPALWEFHKVHHSVKEMGFAAHLRFHCMETVIYKTIQYIPLAMIGFGIDDFFIVHIISLAIGHLNHANVGWGYGALGYVFNNPKMHIWHHAKTLPGKHGVNFGLSLSVWDYLFNTAYIPRSGKEVELGFEQDDIFPRRFFGQFVFPWKTSRRQ